MLLRTESQVRIAADARERHRLEAVVVHDLLHRGRKERVAAEDRHRVGQREGTAEVVVEYLTFLPLVVTPGYPDLIVEDVTVTSTDITMVIRNVGTAPVTGGFYVDAYISLLDPNAPPTGVNDIWQDFSPQGIVWGVDDDPTFLIPGNSVTLTLNDSHQIAAYTDFTLPWATGTAVYVQVDSASAGNTDGGISEQDEINGDPYNNILGPVFVP